MSFLGPSLVTISSSHLSWPLSGTRPLQSVSKSTAWSCAFLSALSKRILQFLSHMSYLVKTVRFTLLTWTTTLFFMWTFWWPHLSIFRPSERLWKTNQKKHFHCLHIHMPLPTEGKISFALSLTSCSYHISIVLESKPVSFLTNY